MEHRVSTETSTPIICGGPTDKQGKLNLEDWWIECGSWYEINTEITLQDFEKFPLKNGFNKGDIILLRGTKKLSVGDIIVFESKKPYPIIHRIIEKNEMIKTKGDNNAGLIMDSELNEENITRDLIIGKAYARIPYLGYVKIWFTNFINLFIN